jgi:hypothetical protein
MTNNRFAGFADNGGIPEGFTPPKRKKIPKVRNRVNVPIDDEIGKPAEKGITMTDYDYDTSRGPYHAILDKMARAHQAATGLSYAASFVAVYTDPANAAIRDGSKHDDLAKAFDSVYGTAHSLVKAAPPDPPQDDIGPGPAHDRLDELVITRMRAEPKLSHAQAFVREYLHPANRSLKQRYDAESDAHMRRLAPVPAFPPYGHPGDRAYPNPAGREGPRPKGSVGG